MILNITKHIGPHGMPMYLEEMPNVGSVSIRVIVFVGSTDDREYGNDGLFHWFEHAPFRGTKYLPGGKEEFVARFGRYGVNRNASTGYYSMTFKIDAPKEYWREGLRLALDLAANPLLRHEDIVAERTIIEKEISRRNAASTTPMERWINSTLYKDHPLGREILGNDSTLYSMTPEQLREAHNEAFSWNRMALIFSGDVSNRDVIEESSDFIVRHPLKNLQARRGYVGSSPLSYCVPQVYENSGRTGETSVEIYLPLPARMHDFSWQWVQALLNSAGSPLVNELREQRSLVYGIGAALDHAPDYYHLRIVTGTRKDRASEVVRRIEDVLRSARLRSEELFERTRDQIRASIAFQALSPQISTGRVLAAINEGIEPDVSASHLNKVLAIPREEVLQDLKTLAETKPICFVYKGTD